MDPWLVLALKFLMVTVILMALKSAVSRGGRSHSAGMSARYRLRDDFMSTAELHFYHQLCVASSPWAVILTKVNLADLFYATGGLGNARIAAWNRINRKHVDYLLCHPQTLQPLLAVELDDSSHARPRRVARDRFVDEVFAQAGLALVHVPLRANLSPGELTARLHSARSTPVAHAETPPQPTSGASVNDWQTLDSDGPALGPPPCPKCGALMVRRVAQRGQQPGSEFWGCPNYPHCRGIRQI